MLERQLLDMDRKYNDLKRHLLQLRKQYASTMASLQQQQHQQQLRQQQQQQQHRSAKEGSTELCLGSPTVGSVALKKQFSMNEDDDMAVNDSTHRDDLNDHSDVLGVLESATRSQNYQRRNRPQSANAAVLSVNTTHGTFHTAAYSLSRQH